MNENDEIRRAIRAEVDVKLQGEAYEDVPDNRIRILVSLREVIAGDLSLHQYQKFNIQNVITSEICVEKVRRNIRQLSLNFDKEA